MPLIKREVEPTELSRGSIAPGIRNELECVTNNTLANVIRQVRRAMADPGGGGQAG